MRAVAEKAKQAQRVEPRAAAIPLAEGITKLPYGFYAKMDDEHLVTYAQRIINNDPAMSRPKRFEKAHPGIYANILKRKLTGRLHFKEKRERTEWARMKPPQIISQVQDLIDEHRIRNRTELKRGFSRIYEMLRTRGWLDRVQYGLPYTATARAILDDAFPGSDKSYEEKAAALAASLDEHRKRRLEKEKSVKAPVDGHNKERQSQQKHG